jgi:hypothetical protein
VEEIEPLTDLFATVLDGRNARLADGVRRALGRQPRDFRDYARTTAASGVWNVAAEATRSTRLASADASVRTVPSTAVRCLARGRGVASAR